MLTMSNVAEFVSVHGSDLRVGDKIYLDNNSSCFTVDKVQQVVGVSLKDSHFGEHLLNLDQLTAIPIPEPRLKLRMDWGALYGYWYPNRQIFAMIDYNGAWEQLVSIRHMPCVFTKNHTHHPSE